MMASSLFCIFLLLIVSYHDVNMIALFYLKLWCCDKKKNYVIKNEFKLCMLKEHEELIDSYFPTSTYIYCLEIISWDDFFQFICIFTFFDFSDILPLLSSLSGNNSNLHISEVLLIYI